MLEKNSSNLACFVTLTYRDEELHDVSADWDTSRPLVPNLEPRDLQLWLKKIRMVASRHGLYRLRFYAVGEYGELTGRPHYHVALFGFPSCLNVGTRCSQSQRNFTAFCGSCKMVAETWVHGHIDVGELTQQSASYIAGYVTKKFTEDSKWEKQGRRKQFQRMSLKPGIGAIAIKNCVTNGVRIQSERQKRTAGLIKSIDAPVVLRNNGSILPLGRYLKRKWREALGRSPDTPQSVIDATVQKLHQENQEAKVKDKKLTSRDVYFIKNAQKIKTVEKRFKIYQTKETL